MGASGARSRPCTRSRGRRTPPWRRRRSRRAWLPPSRLVADPPHEADKRRILMVERTAAARREERLVGPVAPELAANQEALAETVLRGQRDLLERLFDSAEQPVVVQPFVACRE